MNKLIGLVMAVVFLGVSSVAVALPVAGGALDLYFQSEGWDIDVTEYLNPTLDGFGLTTGSTASHMTFYHEVTGDYTFGIYSLNGPEYVQVFDEVNTPIAATLVSFLGGITTMNYYDSLGNEVGSQSHAFTGNTFGIYATNGHLLHSDSDLNTNGVINILTYEIAPGAFVFAADVEGDGTFNGAVMHAESLNPVPEPGTMLLLGTGLAGLVGLRRKNSKK